MKQVLVPFGARKIKSWITTLLRLGSSESEGKANGQAVAVTSCFMALLQACCDQKEGKQKVDYFETSCTLQLERSRVCTEILLVASALV